MGDKSAALSANLAVVTGKTGDNLAELTAAGFASYGRYWSETLKLPTVNATEIDRGFSYTGLDHILDCLREGNGAIIALPHLGGWEWAAAWLGRVAGSGVTAVVESLEPAEVFEWFGELRESYDVDVVPLGPSAGTAVMSALASNRIVTLLADRDIGANGLTVELFGRATRIPSGPALMALRSGTPILPTAVYFRDHDRICHIGEPIPAVRNGRLRDDVLALSEQLADALEALIAAAPEQWHVLEPFWPDDLGSSIEGEPAA
jgi:lauroyl/myristoyl acyltransferase